MGLQLSQLDVVRVFEAYAAERPVRAPTWPRQAQRSSGYTSSPKHSASTRTKKFLTKSTQRNLPPNDKKLLRNPRKNKP
eukprot:1576742-Amphidinium_carterae.1